MKTKIKVLSLVTSFIIAISLSFALSAENVEAQDAEGCWYSPTAGECSGPNIDCVCIDAPPIIVTPE